MSSSHYAEELSDKNIPKPPSEIKYSLGSSDNSSESLAKKIGTLAACQKFIEVLTWA